MSQTILVVDDESKLREMLRLYLTQEGFKVAEAANGHEALFMARQIKPDLVLLDHMMPVMNGPEFLRQFSREFNTPVIMLTARVDDADKIVGLEMGADDYITKPFNVRELLARIRVVLRRVTRSEGEHERLRVGDVLLDRTTVSVTVADKPVELTRSEFELLAALMAAPGRVFSRLDLMEKVSGDGFDGYERTIDVHIRNLRSKIEPDPRHPKYIETVYGMGYKFHKD